MSPPSPGDGNRPDCVNALRFAGVWSGSVDREGDRKDLLAREVHAVYGATMLGAGGNDLIFVAAVTPAAFAFDDEFQSDPS